MPFGTAPDLPLGPGRQVAKLLHLRMRYGCVICQRQAGWMEDVRGVLEEATLKLPEIVRGAPVGKRGAHSEHLGFILSEMQHLQRTYPGCQW